jgi:hypothetical protein
MVQQVGDGAACGREEVSRCGTATDDQSGRSGNFQSETTRAVGQQDAHALSIHLIYVFKCTVVSEN